MSVSQTGQDLLEIRLETQQDDFQKRKTFTLCSPRSSRFERNFLSTYVYETYSEADLQLRADTVYTYRV